MTYKLYKEKIVFLKQRLDYFIKSICSNFQLIILFLEFTKARSKNLIPVKVKASYNIKNVNTRGTSFRA